MEINRKLRKETAATVGVSEEEVAKVISFQWKYLYEGVKSSDCVIRIPRIGTFSIRLVKLMERRKRVEEIITKFKQRLNSPDEVELSPVKILSLIDEYEEELEILYKKLFNNSGRLAKLHLPYSNEKTGRPKEIEPVPPEFMRLLGS